MTPVWWHVWWDTGEWDEIARYYKATVLKVLPYTGRYPQFFNAVLRLGAPRTHRGHIEMAVHLGDKHEPRSS